MYILSDFILDKELSASEKLIYMVLASYRNEEGICCIPTKDIAYNTDLSIKTISTILNSLKQKGLIEINKMNIYNIKRKLENKNLKDLGIGDKECTWCKCSTYLLHAHHFPVRQENGGIETVDICPNCHQEFHFLENNIKIIDKGYIKT